MRKYVIIFFIFLLSTAASGRDQAARAESFEDDSGRTIRFEKPFDRIISLYGAHTENLFRLGLDEQIIGVTRHEVYPPEALKKPEFHYREDPEKFIAASPDLVLVRPMIVRGHRGFVDKLEQAGIAVVSLQPTTIDGMYEYWLRLGMLTGRTAGAEEMVSSFKADLKALRAKTEGLSDTQRKRVYFESIHSKMKTFTPDSMAVFVLESAGGINIAEDAGIIRVQNIASYGKEHILAKAEEIDVYLAQIGPMNEVDVRTIENEPGFRIIKAVREGRVYLVDEQLVSRPTFRLLQGVREIGRILYPDLFPENTLEKEQR